MDINKFNKKLNKISALSGNFSNDGYISSLERDLLLSYIRELYEIAMDEEVTVIAKVESVPPKVTINPTPEPVIEKKVEIPVPVVKEVHEVVIPAVVQTLVEIHQVIDEIKEPEKPASVKTNIATEVLNELFAEEKITDLSDKLALTPIKDLTKSMGINEKIFTQQELFGNNQSHFIETLDGLNKCQNFEEAKQYLINNVISKNDWGSEQKIKKAATFIKLVKRKFV